MSKIEKFKRTVFIAIGFGLATYLIINGMAMLDAETKLNENNITRE